MRDLFQQGTVDNLLDASDICKATDPEQRRCAIEQMGNPAARQHLTFQIVEACAPAKPEIHECMLAYLHHESPFNFVPAENIGDAHDLCAYWAWAGPESKACLQAYYGRKPPFDVVHPPLQDQALLVCGFKDPSLQRCLLDGIQRSDRAKIVNCLTSPKVSQADKKSCQDYLWTRLHDEWTTNDVCSIANSELRKCAVAKVIEGLPFYQANLVCSWDDVALLMKGAPPCEGASGHSP